MEPKVIYNREELDKDLNKIGAIKSDGKSKENTNKLSKKVKNTNINSNINSINNKKVNNTAITIQCDITKEKKTFCTNEVKKHVSVLFILLFVLIFLMSSASFVIITFTNIFNKNIVENLVLRNGSKSLDWWIDSPIKPLLKVHVFNYTNIDAVLRGEAEKIKIEDVGPYVYEETLQRVELTYLDGNKIKFFENRTQRFMRHLTPNHLSEDDIVYVPNIPLIMAVDKVTTSKSFEFALKAILTTVKPQEFQAKTAKEYLFGYTDSLTSKFQLTMDDYRPEKFGILGSRKGISTDSLTIFTGEDDLDNLGKVYAMNDESNLTLWDTEECNEVKGTDGSQFSLSDLADEESSLQIWVKAICRTFNLKYDREVTVLNGIPAKRYIPEPNLFGSSRKTESNRCYCDAEDDYNDCPPDGVFDARKCVDVGLLMSYPHFYEADEVLLEPYKGLKPNKDDHGTFVDVHPRMAFPIGGASRMQINVRLKKFSYMAGIFQTKTLFDKLPTDLILPLCWFEITVGEVPPELLAMVFNTTHSVNATFLTIQYGSIICMFVSFLLIISTTYFYFKRIGEDSGETKCQNMFSMLSTHPTNSQT